MSELNRRNFLKGAVAATASLAAAAALGGCSQTASSAAAGSAAASSTAASEAAQTTAEGPYLQYDICGKLSMSEFEASAAVAVPEAAAGSSPLRSPTRRTNRRSRAPTPAAPYRQI